MSEDLQDKISKDLKFFEDQQNVDLGYAFEIDSGKKGDTVVIFGGVHGNEPSGVRAMIEFKKYLDLRGLQLNQGRVLFVLGNPEAYRKGVRFIDQNLNRVFLPEVESSDVEGQRAKEIMDFLKAYGQVDYFLDLHSVSVGEFQIAVYSDNATSRDRVLEFSNLDMHFAVKPEHLPGTVFDLAEQIGVVGYSIECGNHESEQAVGVAWDHILELLIRREIISVKDFEGVYQLPKKPTEVQIYITHQKIVPQPGFRFLNAEVTTGTFVKKSEIYAKSDQQDYIAEKDLHVMMPDKNPRVKDSDAGFLCEREVVKVG